MIVSNMDEKSRYNFFPKFKHTIVEVNRWNPLSIYDDGFAIDNKLLIKECKQWR